MKFRLFMFLLGALIISALTISIVKYYKHNKDIHGDVIDRKLSMKDITIIIPSFDNYSELWPVGLNSIYNNWPSLKTSNKNTSIILTSNYKSYDDGRVINIKIGNDKGWSDSLIEALKHTKTKYILIILDDYILTQEVNENRLIEIANYMNVNKAAYTGLIADEGLFLYGFEKKKTFASGINGVIIRSKEGEYRGSLQASIWDKKALEYLLEPGMSAWDFERKGNKKTKLLKNSFLSLADEPVFSYLNAVEKRVYRNEFIDYIEANNIKFNYDPKKIKTPYRDFIEVDFDEAMGSEYPADYKLYFEKPEGKAKYEFFKNLYNQNKPSSQGDVPKGNIPKVIHQIWINPKKDLIPEKYVWFQETFENLHPTWEYKLWRDEDIMALDFPDKDLYTSARTYTEKSDVARYAILQKFGGLYVDSDTLCIKSFDSLIKYYDFVAGIEPNNSTGYPHLINALIATTPNHPIINKTLEIVRQNWNAIEEDYESNKLTGNDIFWLVQKRTFFPLNTAFMEVASLSDKNIIAMPATYFYPKYFDKKYFDTIRKNTISMHDFDKMKTSFKKFDFIKNSLDKPTDTQLLVKLDSINRLFDKNNPNNASYNSTNKIPDVIHFVNTDSEYVSLLEWQDHYTNLTYKIWTMAQIEEDPSLQYSHLLAQAKDPEQKLILAKLILAYNLGGVFPSKDIKPVNYGKNEFSQLILELDNKYDFYGVLEPNLKISTNLFAFSKNHIILEHIFSEISKNISNPNVTEIFDAVTYKYMFVGKNIIFPPEYFIQHGNPSNEYTVTTKD